MSNHHSTPPHGPNHYVRGVLLVGGSALLSSTGGLIVRSLQASDPWTTVFWRSTTATLCLFLFLLVRDGRNVPGLFRRMGAPGLLVGFCFACASVGFVVALSLTSVAQTLTIMSSSPLVAAVLGRVLLGERIRPVGYLSIAGVMIGIALMMSADLPQDRSFAGAMVALLVAVSLAGAIVTTRRYPHIRMTPAVCTGTAMAMAVSLPFAAPLSVGTHDFALLALFGAGQLSVCLILFVTGARLIPASQSALLGMLEPILGPAWVWLAFGERPAVTTLVGGTVVIFSVAANTLIDIRSTASRAARQA